jgi:hypothetical protein
MVLSRKGNDGFKLMDGLDIIALYPWDIKHYGLDPLNCNELLSRVNIDSYISVKVKDMIRDKSKTVIKLDLV